MQGFPLEEPQMAKFREFLVAFVTARFVPFKGQTRRLQEKAKKASDVPVSLCRSMVRPSQFTRSMACAVFSSNGATFPGRGKRGGYHGDFPGHPSESGMRMTNRGGCEDDVVGPEVCAEHGRAGIPSGPSPDHFNV